tara:strand:- start:78 stop:272 length:195 start_codon:yes stop_codon:yes gene_type:complete
MIAIVELYAQIVLALVVSVQSNRKLKPSLYILILGNIIFKEKLCVKIQTVNVIHVLARPASAKI